MGAVIKIIVLLLLLPSVIFAACPGTPADCYTTVACTNGETGTCRQAINCTSDAVQATINAADGTGTGIAADGLSFGGDGVYIPECSETPLTARLAWTNKNISVIGAGIDTTIIKPTTDGSFAVTVTNPSRAQFRISNMTLQSTTTTFNIAIFASGASGISSGWRIDNIKHVLTTSGRFLYITGISYGLIDSCTITSVTQPLLLVAYNSVLDGDYSGDYLRAQDLDLGGATAVYFENNTVTRTDNAQGSVLMDIDAGGGSLVMRYNNLYGGLFYTHNSRGSSYTTKKLEIYNNSVVGNYGGTPTEPIAGRLAGGTGVYFNNVLSGFTNANALLDEGRATGDPIDITAPLLSCDGTHAWDGALECVDGDGNLTEPVAGVCADGSSLTGWPCFGQNGRGAGVAGSLAWQPWFAWNNNSGAVGLARYGDTTNYVRGSTEAHANGQYEFYNMPASVDTLAEANTIITGEGFAAYTPYTCPHPLTGKTGVCSTTTQGPAGYNVEEETTYYDLTPSIVNSTGGTLIPFAVEPVASGANSSTYTATPDNGWKIKAWAGTCGATGTASTYQKEGVTEACTVTVEFEEVKLMPW